MPQTKTIWTGRAPDLAWADPRNWSNGVPIAGVDAVFDDRGSLSINLPASAASGTLLVSRDHLTLLSGSLAFAPVVPTSGQTYDMKLSHGAVLTVARGAHLSGAQTAEIGTAASAAALIVHGSVAEDYTEVFGTLAIAGRDALWSNGESGLDILGNGQLSITGGARLQSSNPNGSLEVEGLGAAALVSGPGTVVREPLLFVGEFAAGGTMTIADGAAVYDSGGNVGASGDGSITVTGPGSEWINSAGISIGGQVPGSAQLSILKGAHVGFGDYGMQLEGTLAIDGSASLTGGIIVSGGGVIMAEPGGPRTVTLTQNIEINYNLYNVFGSETTYVGATGGEALRLTGDITAGYSSAPETLAATIGTVILAHAGNSYDATDLYGATLVIAAENAAGRGLLTFIGGSHTPATLIVDPGLAFNNQISGFGGGDTIDAAGIKFGADFSASWTAGSAGGTLTLSDGQRALTLNFSGSYSLETFDFAPDAHGGTAVTFAQPPTALAAFAHPHLAG
jgi:T5SS/PEP-CTERM-associated repeat protein